MLQSDQHFDLAMAATSLKNDRLAANISAAFDAHGITSILLKGASIALWLYRDGEVRGYGDADLMVSPSQLELARSVLRKEGFTIELAPLEHPGLESSGGQSWRRGPDNIDLHCTLWGLGADPENVWLELSEGTEEMVIGGRPLRVLGPEARTMHLALHAAQHADGWPSRDLERAIEMLPSEHWERAAELAARLDATPAFASGLRLVEGGPDIVARLGLGEATSPEADLRAWRVPLSTGFAELSETRGVLAKLRLIWGELFPTPAFMRWWTPIASHGSLGLACAYGWRLVWCVSHIVPGYRAWRRAYRA